MIEKNNNQGDVYEFTLSPSNERYYSDDTYYGVYEFSTINKIPHTRECMLFEDGNNETNIGVIAGNTGKLEYGVEYKIKAEIEFNKKYKSWQYKPIEIVPIVPTKLDQAEKFLISITTKNQTKALLDKYPNIVDMVINRESIDLSDIKGIKEKTFERIKDKIESTYGMMELTVFLNPLGVSAKAIEKLFETGTSSKVIKSKIQENPYMISDIKGFGFKKADDIALKLSPHLRVSKYRTIAYVKFLLNDIANNHGHTWVNTDKFLQECRNNIPECKEFIFELLKEEDSKFLYVDRQRKRVGLKSLYNLEKNIAQEIIRLKNGYDKFKYGDIESKIKNIEDSQGWEFTNEQLDGVRMVMDNQVIVVTGLGGCVDMDTEYFNGTEWVKIKDYKIGDKVLQYNEDGTATLEKPTRYIKQPSEKLYLIDKIGFNQCVSEDHNMVYVSSKGNLNTKSMKELLEMHNKSTHGFSQKFITAFEYNGKGISLNDSQIRLAVAILADGSFCNNNNTCRFRIKKERKKERLEWLFSINNINYKKTQSMTEGYTDFYIYKNDIPIKDKTFEKYWYNCTKEQLQIIADEVMYWDGNISGKRRRYSSTHRQDADFIQFVFSAIGNRAKINAYDRRGRLRTVNGKEYITKSIDYEVHISSKSKYVALQGGFGSPKTKIKEYIPVDGYEYCFTVSSGMWVQRRNGYISITGNCGKTSVATAITEILNNYKIAQVALSGKAALRMQEVTGRESSTIHRLLGFEDGKFIYNKSNPLEFDVVVIDEASMIGADLFYKLLQAIPDSAKVIILGDIGQLESIGVGSVFKDMLESNVISTVNLTKIHRQAKKSAIITESINIRNQKHIIDKDFYGSRTLGELQDLHLDIYEDKDETIEKVIDYFRQEYKKSQDLMEIQVVVPMRERGSSSVYSLNNKIQEIVNPANKNKIEVNQNIRKGMPYVIRVGDKIMNMVNQYKTLDTNGILTPVFNGNLGIVKAIYSKEMVIDFVGIGELVIEKDNWKNIELGYASTAHKLQGSEFNTIIVGVDSSSYVMLSKEWLYTAVTRSKKMCYLCGDNYAIRTSVKQSNLVKKLTHLKELLVEQEYLSSEKNNLNKHQ